MNEGNFGNLDNDKYNFKHGVNSEGKKYVKVTERIYDPKTKSYTDDTKGKAKSVWIWSADGLTQYIKGVEKQKNLATSIYNSGKDDYYKLNNTTLEGTYKVPTASRAEWIKAGWSVDQINQAQKQGKIKVI